MLDDYEPVFYTTEELQEIKNKIKMFMRETEIRINNTDDIITRNCKFTAIIANDEKNNNNDDKIIDAYINYPPFLFYTDSVHNSIRRICGFEITNDGEILANIVSALFISNNDVVECVDLSECIHVKKWSKLQLERLTSGLINDADAFLEMDGYITFAI